MDGTRRVNPTANEEVRNEMLDIYMELGSLNEVDWSKVRDMSFNEDRTNKRVAAEKIATSNCLECPDFLEHVPLAASTVLIKVRGIPRRISCSSED